MLLVIIQVGKFYPVKVTICFQHMSGRMTMKYAAMKKKFIAETISREKGGVNIVL